MTPDNDVASSKALWFAVMMTGLEDYVDSDDEWIFDEGDSVGQMEWICDHLDLNAEWVRRGAVALKEAGPKGLHRVGGQWFRGEITRRLREAIPAETSGPDALIGYGELLGKLRAMCMRCTGQTQREYLDGNGVQRIWTCPDCSEAA